MGVGQMFSPFGIVVGEDQHIGAGAADFGGHLSTGVSPRATVYTHLLASSQP
jgi:hypothetical protein